MKTMAWLGACSITLFLVCCSRDDETESPKPAGFENGVYQWLVQQQRANGLLESTPGNNFVSLYDNSLAAIAFISKGDYKKAEAIFDFFNERRNSELLAETGGFYQFRDRDGIPLAGSGRWLGDNAWMLIALNNYRAKTSNTRYADLESDLANWIRNLQDVDGSLWGGYDPKTGVKTGKVTENMIDAFNAIPGYDDFHKQLLSYFYHQRWDAVHKSLVCDPGGYYKYALDNFSWGFCALENFSTSSLGFADELFLTTFKSEATQKEITGYCTDVDRDNVFLEGTGSMVVAFQKAGLSDKAQFYLAELEKAAIVLTNGTIGIPYATNIGSGYGPVLLWQGADKNPCVSSAAWYYYGKTNFDPMEVGCMKNIPASDKFWLPQ